MEPEYQTLKPDHRQGSAYRASFISDLNEKAAVLSDPLEINRLATQSIGQFFEADRCYFCEWKTDPNQITIVHDWHTPDLHSLCGTFQLEDFGPPEWIARAREGGLTIEDINDESLSAHHRANLEALQIRAYFTSRVLKQDSGVIALAVTSRQPRKWQEHEKVLLENLAARIWPLIERARVYISLRDNEEHLRLALSVGNIGHWNWDPKTDIIKISERTAQIFDIPSGQVITRTEMRKLLHPDDREKSRVALLKSLETGEDYDIEYRLDRSEGDEKWVAAKGRPISSQDGKTVEMLGVVLDVTAQRKAEKAIRQRGERMQLLSEMLTQLLSAVDPDKMVRDLFPKVSAHLGADTYVNYMVNERGDALELNSCAGIPEETVRSIQHLEFGAAICGTVAQSHEPIIANNIQTTDYDKAALVRSFGIQTYVCNPLKVKDRLLGTLSFASRTRCSFDADELEFIRIISQQTAVALDRLFRSKALRESSERLAASLAAAGTGTFRWNIKTNAMDWDEPLNRLFGLAQEEKVHALEHIYEIIHPDDRAEIITRYERSARQGENFDSEFRVIWKDASIHWLDGKGKVFLDALGKPEYMVGACVDITARKASEQALWESREKLKEHAGTLERRVSERTSDLQEANEQMEQFCYAIAHDLRAPLRAQEGFATALIEEFSGSLGEKGVHYANRVVQGARRLDSLVQDLLNFSRISRDFCPIEDVELAGAFAEARQNVAEMIAETRTELIVPPLAGTVRAHSATLVLIFQNLLSNAMKFTVPGIPPKIQVWSDTETCHVRCHIKDEGIGIAPEHHERIFGVFQRLHDKATYPGTGIGLSLVSKGIKRMGGKVGLNSAEGKGSDFWIELPRVV